MEDLKKKKLSIRSGLFNKAHFAKIVLKQKMFAVQKFTPSYILKHMMDKSAEIRTVSFKLYQTTYQKFVAAEMFVEFCILSELLVSSI